MPASNKRLLMFLRLNHSPIGVNAPIRMHAATITTTISSRMISRDVMLVYRRLIHKSNENVFYLPVLRVQIFSCVYHKCLISSDFHLGDNCILLIWLDLIGKQGRYEQEDHYSDRLHFGNRKGNSPSTSNARTSTHSHQSESRESGGGKRRNDQGCTEQ